MGLLDILHGMQNGPRGAREPGTTSGMSKMAMALIALLGYKTLKTGTQPTSAPGGDPSVNPAEATSANAPSGGIMGGLGDLLKGPLGGILAGASAGSVVNGGLSDLLNQFRQSGHGDVAGSWVGNGPNRPISPADLSKALGTDQINTLMSQSGLSRNELLTGLSDQLPRLVDHLTPNGRMPTDEEMSRLVWKMRITSIVEPEVLWSRLNVPEWFFANEGVDNFITYITGDLPFGEYIRPTLTTSAARSGEDVVFAQQLSEKMRSETSLWLWEPFWESTSK